MNICRTEEDMLEPLKRRIHEVYGIPRAVLDSSGPRMDMERLAEFAGDSVEPVPSPGPDGIQWAANQATIRARRERNGFRKALRQLVSGIDVQGEDGTWSIDRDALGHARRVLGIEEEAGR